jgi:hypothetical protein
MPWTAVRKDIVFNANCHRCGRPLASNVGIVLRDDQNQEQLFGPDCAAHLVGETAKSVPDLTIVWYTQASGTAGAGGKSLGGRRSRRRGPPPDQAAEQRIRAAMAASYLMLRADKLAHVSGVSTPALELIYRKFRRFGYLTPNQIRHILNIEAKCAREFPRYSAQHLRWVYACDSLLCRALETVEPRRRRFLTEMRDKLRAWLRLSPREIEAINSWLDRVDGTKQLPFPAVVHIPGGGSTSTPANTSSSV